MTTIVNFAVTEIFSWNPNLYNKEPQVNKEQSLGNLLQDL
jgi:hypothetical protein